MKRTDDQLQLAASPPASSDVAEAYRVAVEETLQGVVILQDFRVVFANPAICRLTGYTREELVSLSAEDLRTMLHPEDRDEAWGRLEARPEGPPEPARHDLRFRTRDGRTRWIELVATRVAYGGRPAVLYTYVDVTERKHAERALRESEARFAKAFLASPTPALIASLESGRVLDANQSLERTTGFRRSDLVGRPTQELQLFAGPEQVLGMLRSLRQGGSVRAAETPYIHASGEERQALLFAEPITLGGERCAIWQGIDVTERKQAEEERRRLAEQGMRARRLEGLGVLAGGVAHDFNNLLVAIRGNAELALLRLEPGHPARGRMEDVDRAAGRAADLTRSLLTYAGRGRVDNEPVDLAALARDTLRILRSGLPPGARVRVSSDEPGPWVEGDATQLGQVVMNLLTNAAEALEGGAGDVALRVGSATLGPAELAACVVTGGAQPGEYALLEVRDDGRGMDPETLERIFDPFYTTKFQGRGLGLAGVLGVVRGHGGAMRVESAPGRGAVFRVYLPRVQAGPAERRPATGATGGASGAAVLVVDDEAAVCAVAARMLEAGGYAPIPVSGGAEALERMRLAPERVDAALLDLTMPGMGGEEVFAALRRLRPDLPVVFMSGHGEDDVARRLEGLEGVRHVAKPFRLEQVLGRLREVLEEAEARRG